MADNDYMSTQEVLTGIKTWVKKEIGTNIYDISANHNGAKYADLSAALGNNGANVPINVRKGGMSVKFVQTYDNKYVQARFMLSGSFTSAQFTNSANWQGEDAEPTAGSENFVKSGGINKSILDGWKLATDITTSVFDQNHRYWNLLGDLKANVNYIIAITANSRVVSDVALRYTERTSTSAGEMIKANAVLNGTQYFKVTPSQDAKYLYLASVDNVGDDISSVVVYQQTNAAEILTKVEQKTTFSTGEKVNDVSIGNNLPDYTNKIVKEKFVISEALKNIIIPNSNVSATVFNQNHRFWDFGSTLVKGKTYIIVISANTSVVSDVYLRYTERTSTSAGQLIKSSCPLEGTLYFKVTPLEDAKYLNLPSVDNLGNDISSVIVYDIFPMEMDSIPTSGSIKTVQSGGVYLNDEKSFGAIGLPIYKLGGYAGSYFNAVNNKRLTIDKIKYGIEYTLAYGYKLSAAVIFKDDGTFVKQGATESELKKLDDDCYAAISVGHNSSHPSGDDSVCSINENPFSSIFFGDDMRIRHIFGYKTNSVGDYYQKMWSTAKCTPYMYQKVNTYGSYNYNLVLAINTDTHAYTSDVLNRINRWPIQCFKDSNLLDAFLSLGDIFWANQNRTKVQRYEEAEKIWNTVDAIGASQRPQLVCIGNHDNNQDGGQANTEYFTQEDKYNCFIKPMLERFSSNHTSLDTESKYTGWRKLPIVTDNVDYPTYYSIEFAAKKTKLIVLDCYDFSDEYLLGSDYVINSAYYSERELDFLVSQLNSTPDDYKVIIGTHHIYDSGSIIALGNSANVLKTILAAFVNKTSASATLRDEKDTTDVKTYNVSFGESSGDLLWLVGHVHIFEEKKLSVNSVGSIPIHCFSCISADQEGKLQRGYMIDGFDIFNYDYVNHYFVFTRYGDKGTLYGTNPNNNDSGDSNGFHFAELVTPLGMSKGSSANRPILNSSKIGFQYFDTTLNKPIWYAGSNNWVDANGTTV